MPYYHVLIETYESSNPYYKLDWTDLSKIKEEVVIPHLKGDQFIFNGYFLDKTKVKRILIKESDCTSKNYADDMDKKYPNYPLPTREQEIMEDDEYTRDITQSTIEECKSQIQEAAPKSEALAPNNPKAPMNKSKVFIVHGHDNAAREAAARFVENLGFEAIILHEQANSGQTIIEKIEENTNVGFAIVLYTPCDEVVSKGKKDPLKPRARQNVVFEHGYLMAKIGRKNVCPLVKGDLEIPTDISGIVYTPMDEGGGWKLAVADEMEACGYKVDRSKIKR